MRMISRHTCALALAAVLAAMPLAGVQAQQTPSEATISYRWQLLNPEVNSYTFRNTYVAFEYRPVEKGGDTWPLERAAGFTMPGDYEAFADRTFTNAFMVLKDGKVVFEDYRNRMGPETPHIAFSMSKTITAMLVGIAVGRGDIESIDDQAVKYVPELAGSGYDGVTVRQILEMRSGVDIAERYDFGENPSLAATIHEMAIVRNEKRFADFAVDIGRKTEPGSTFNYATLDTAVLGWILEKATGQSIERQTQERLWQPMGAEFDAYWLADGQPGVGRALNGMGYNARLRDFARLGQLMLDDGMANGRRVLPEGWVAQMTAIKPTNGEYPGYGFQTWKIDDEPGSYTFVGLAGQYIYVHPETRTVVVKLSYYPPVTPDGLETEVGEYFAAVAHSPAASAD